MQAHINTLLQSWEHSRIPICFTVTLFRVCCGINGACEMRQFRVANISNFHCGQFQFSLRQPNTQTHRNIYYSNCCYLHTLVHHKARPTFANLHSSTSYSNKSKLAQLIFMRRFAAVVALCGYICMHKYTYVWLFRECTISIRWTYTHTYICSKWNLASECRSQS